MVPAPLVSESGQPTWEYIRPGLGRTGRSLSENNFAKERRDWLAILLREVLQNALDARTSPDIPVTVTLNCRTLDDAAAKWIGTLVTDSHLARFQASLPHVRDDPPAAVTSCLVVEDFGTSGLTGTMSNPNLDGKGQNWNAFWFREGEGGKENTAGNGGAGQGKITYFSTSAIRTIFAYTVRSDDNGEALMGACSFLRDYDYGGRKWKRDAYWGIGLGEHEDRVVLPTADRTVIDSFRSHLGLTRESNQSGLSLVIPSPKEFDHNTALQILIAEFFVPLLRGDLVVYIGGERMDKANVEELASRHLPDDRARDLHTCMTSGYRSFLADSLTRSMRDNVVRTKRIARLSDISEELFTPDDLVKLREAIDAEDIVSVRIPVSVRSKADGTTDCHFDIHLACPFELDRPEQAVIRRDLLIGEEPVGGGKLRQRARGFTLIGDNALSKLLLAAEEATHLRWNTRLPRLAEYYRDGPTVVAVVRNAMSRLLDVLTEGDQKRNFKLLAKYFSAPGVDSPEKTKGRKKGRDSASESNDIPPPKAKLLKLEALDDGCRVRPATKGALAFANLPMEVLVEFAYEGLDRDAFNEYDPLDFDLMDKAFVVNVTNCTVVHRQQNQLAFTVDTPDCEMQVSGFDRNLRLRMRLSYEEVPDAAALNAE